jgi:hypothetical protein
MSHSNATAAKPNVVFRRKAPRQAFWDLEGRTAERSIRFVVALALPRKVVLFSLNRLEIAVELALHEASHADMTINSAPLSIASATIHEGEGFSCDMLQLPSDQPAFAFEGSNHRGSAAPVFGDCFRGRVCGKALLGIPREPSGLGYLEPCWKQRQETTPP